MKILLLLPIRAYQYALSPLMGAICRFYPTCSSYAKEAIEVHGALHGGWLGVKRILRCNPWSLGGVDYVDEHLDCADVKNLTKNENRIEPKIRINLKKEVVGAGL